MEEILASIKRVIAEDGQAAARPAYAGRPAEAQMPQPFAEEDVLELDDPVEEDSALVSEDATAASRQSLAALSAMREQSEPVAPGDGALEAVVRDMLRPMLKDWLDAHLPAMVEELVNREIARIAGKGG